MLICFLCVALRDEFGYRFNGRKRQSVRFQESLLLLLYLFLPRAVDKRQVHVVRKHNKIQVERVDDESAVFRSQQPAPPPYLDACVVVNHSNSDGCAMRMEPIYLPVG